MEVLADFRCSALLPGFGPVSIQLEWPPVRAALWPLVWQNTNDQEAHFVCQYFWDSWWVSSSPPCAFSLCRAQPSLTWSYIKLNIIQGPFKVECFTINFVFLLPFYSSGNFMYFMGYSKWLLLSSRLVAGQYLQNNTGTHDPFSRLDACILQCITHPKQHSLARSSTLIWIDTSSHHVMMMCCLSFLTRMQSSRFQSQSFSHDDF